METVHPPQDHESPRQARYEDGLGARHRCTGTDAEHGGQDGRQWEPASREHGFGRPAVAQRSGGRASREVMIRDQDKIFDRKRFVHNPSDGSAPAMLSQRQQQQLAAVNRSPRASQESMPTEAEWQQEQQAAAATRERRASQQLMSTERKERMSNLMITTEDYGYTERHHSPRQKHYNAMARVDAEQAKQLGLQATPFGLHGSSERPGAQTARGHMEARPSEAHHDLQHPGQQHPGQPWAARASHDKREDDAGRCAAPPALSRLYGPTPRVTARDRAATNSRAAPHGVYPSGGPRWGPWAPLVGQPRPALGRAASGPHPKAHPDLGT